MKILIAGGTGFIGTSIVNHLMLNEDVEYHILTRTQRENHNNVHYHTWDASNMGSWKVYIDHCDILINLTGKSVKCRYNTANKNEIYRSRIDSTYILGEAIAKSSNPPKLWINASTATIYRHETERPNDEYNGILGHGFSVDVAKKWEETFYAAYTPFTRKVNIRAAIVFGKEAEVFKIYQNHINIYLSRRHGSGNQMVSWIHEYDFVDAIKHFIYNEDSTGTYNLAAPNATTDKKFLKSFCKIMNKRSGTPIPAWALEIGAIFCNAETELLLKSRWVYPSRLMEEGFKFQYATHDVGLKELVERETDSKFRKQDAERVLDFRY